MRRSPMSAGIAGVDTRTPAVVLKFDPNVMHHGGLGVIRSLGRLGIPVYGVHEGRWAPAASSRYLNGRWYWQPSLDDAERVRAGLLQLAQRIGQPAVLIPTDDAGAIFLAEQGDALRPSFLFPDPPRDLPRRLAGKHSLYQLCRALGVACPRTTVPGSLSEAAAFAAEAGFPVVAKLTTPWRSGGAKLRSTSIVADQERLADIHRACCRAGAEMMLQEFIPGGPGQDWFLHGYCDAASACRPAFIGIKERSYPAHAGLTSLGRSAPNPRLGAEMTRLLTRLGYRGIMDLDLRWDAIDGQYKLLDFNPRLGAQFRLFRDSAGVDIATAAYLDLTGQVIPEGEQINERRFRVENYDLIGALGYWRGGQLGMRSWLASLPNVDEVAWFARDDLRPFGLMCLHMGWRMATRPLARAARRESRQRAGHDAPRYRPGRNGGRWHGAASWDPLAPEPAVGQETRSTLQEAPGTHQGTPHAHSESRRMTDAVDVVIVGAGPYGLSLAAHLRAAGVQYRHFGLPMRLWRESMPRGMFLKSQGFASNLSDPGGAHTLEAFCKAAGSPYASYGLPVPLDTFVRYGQWFQDDLGLEVEHVLVTQVAQEDGGFQVALADSETVQARNVAVATGVEHFAHLPPLLDGLPAWACTHSSAHADLAGFRGKTVIVIGAGQSALESGALLHESGASVQIVAREQKLAWNGQPLDPHRPLLRRLREPEAGLGSGWNTWFYSNHPDLFRHLPRATRLYRARTALGPAGADWLRPRVEGQVPVLTGHALERAAAQDGEVRLGFITPGGGRRELAADHVLAATGYRADLRRLPFLGDQLRGRLATVGGTACVRRDYQSSVRGLYFIGPAVAPTFGPVMRFVYGSAHAARVVAGRLASSADRRARTTVGAAR
jgi:D-aspartate ligase